MATYYISSSIGDDITGDGTILNPWKTTTKVDSLSLVAGDIVLFKRGDTFVSTDIIYSEGGSVGNPIIYSDYGTGAKAIITGMGDIPGWSISGNWTNIGGNVWTFQFGSYYKFNRLWIDDVESVRVPTTNDINVNATNIWNYHWSDKLYVYSTTNPATTFNSMKVNTIDKIFHCDYGNITFTNLDLQAAHNCIRISNDADNFIIDNCNIGWDCDGRGILSSNSITGMSCDNVIVSNCIFDSNDNMMYVGYEAQSAFAGIDMKNGCSNWEIYNCYFKNWGHSCFDHEASLVDVGYYSDNISIHDNYFTCPDIYYGRAIGIGGRDGYISGVEVYNNYSFDCPTQSQINGGATKIHNNIFDNNNRESLIIAKPYVTGAALAISNSSYLSLTGMEIYNNIFANAFDAGFDFGGYDGSPDMEGLLFINNILYNNGSSVRSSNYQLYIYDQLSMKGNTFKNNLFYKSGITDVIYYGNDATDDYPHTVEEFNLENGTANDIISGNTQLEPLFISSADFRLQSNSPAINAGIDVGLPYSGSAPDIGANETGFYYIDPNGNDSTGNGSWSNPWLTLSHACSQVTLTGSTIYVNAGTYIETQQCNLSVGVSICGEGIISNIISTYSVVGYNKSSIQLESADGTNGNQTISNIKIDGSNLAGACAISVFGRSNVKIHDITIVDFYERGIYLAPSGTVYATGNEIYNCIISNSSTRSGSRGGGLIRIGYQDGILIHDNIFTQNDRVTGQNGNIIDGVDGYNKNVKYYNNKSHKPDDEGVEWNFHFEHWNSNGGIEIYNNEFHGGSAIDVGGENNIKGSSSYSFYIHDNLIQLSSQYPTFTTSYKVGISIEQSSSDIVINNNHFKNLPFGISGSISSGSQTQSGILIHNNIFEDIGWGDNAYSFAISFSGDNGTTSIYNDIKIYNNVIEGGVGKTNAGVHLNSVYTINNVQICNNIFQNIDTYGYVAFWDGAGTISNITLQNNIVYNCVNANVIYYRNGKVVSNLIDTNKLTVDPLFVSSTDFRLQSGSPAINTGIDVGLPYTGSAPDIGANETGFYYIDPNGSDLNDGSLFSPFLTIDKAWTVCSPGDVIYLRSGTYSKTIINGSSGDLGNPITLTSYSGETAIISGFETVTGWTNIGGGIYSKVVNCESAPNLITIDDIQRAKGKFPNNDYLYIDSHNTDISITDADLNSAVTDWTGAEVVIRKNEYVTDRCLISNHVGSTLTYINLSSSQEPSDGYYYFIQNDIRCLTDFGDWCYVSGSSTLYVHFGADSPNLHTVKVPTVDNLIRDNWHSYITIDGIFLEGSNLNSIHFFETNYSTVKNCTIRFGGSGIYMLTNYGVVDNNIISNTNEFAIDAPWKSCITRNNIISNIGIIEGAGFSGTRGSGIGNSGDDGLVEFNTITNVGYNGIYAWGTRTTTRNNYISNYCMLLNDGGGIYTDDWSLVSTGRTIENNIIVNGIGKLGINSYEYVIPGIYMDSHSNNILVKNNTVSNVPSMGIFISVANNIILVDNNIYNCRVGVQYLEWESGGIDSIYGTIMTGNTFVSADEEINSWGTNNAAFIFQSNTGTIGNFGISDYNNYFRYTSDTGSIFTYEGAVDIYWQARTLSNWQSYSGKDLNSHEFIINSISDVFLDYSVEGKSVTGLTGYVTLEGTPITSYTLQPYSSIILMRYFPIGGKVMKIGGKVMKIGGRIMKRTF